MSDFEKIWLQTTDEHGEATWCQNKINDDDVEYIRVDLNKERQGTKEISALCEQSQADIAALKRYVTHHQDCGINVGPGWCTCGLNTLLHEVKENE